jgi:hypothetical protein
MTNTTFHPAFIALIAILVALGGPFTILGTGIGATSLWCGLVSARGARRLARAAG